MKSFAWWFLVVGLGVAGAPVGCATGELGPDEGEEPGAVDPDGGGPEADGAAKPPPGGCVVGQCPPNTWNLDGKTDGENCGCEYRCTKRSEDDELDPAFEDANCDGSDGVVATCVYVSVSKGDDAGDGTRLKPLKTLARAVMVAGSGTKKRPVCVSAEKYTESVELPSGVSLYGGFDQADAAFPFRRSRKHGTTDIATTIVAPTTGPLAGDGVLIRELREDMHVANLTLEVKIPEAQDGKSVHGVRVVSSSGGRLFVRNNVFLLGPGNQGVRGTTDAAPPTTPAATGNTGAGGCSSCSSAQPGAASPSCTAPGGRGGNGGVGSDSSGAAGAPGTGGAAGGGGGSGSACISSSGGSAGLTGASAGTGAPPASGGDGGEPVGTIVNGLYVSSPGKPGLPGRERRGRRRRRWRRRLGAQLAHLHRRRRRRRRFRRLRRGGRPARRRRRRGGFVDRRARRRRCCHGREQRVHLGEGRDGRRRRSRRRGPARRRRGRGRLRRVERGRRRARRERRRGRFRLRWWRRERGALGAYRPRLDGHAGRVGQHGHARGPWPGGRGRRRWRWRTRRQERRGRHRPRGARRGALTASKRGAQRSGGGRAPAERAAESPEAACYPWRAVRSKSSSSRVSAASTPAGGPTSRPREHRFRVRATVGGAGGSGPDTRRSWFDERLAEGVWSRRRGPRRPGLPQEVWPCADV